MRQPSDRLSRVQARLCRVGPWQLNAYALICARSLQSLLIDPGAEPERLLELVSGTTPLAILVTHRHPDHTGALQAVQQKLDIPVMAHAGMPDDEDILGPYQALAHEEQIALGDANLRIYHTPGHTPDQICIGIEGDPRIFVGDTIFQGGPGKTWCPEDFETTLATLRSIVLSWPDDTHCFPGHGADFRLGDIRASVERFLKQDHGGFYGDATWGMSQ